MTALGLLFEMVGVSAFSLVVLAVALVSWSLEHRRLAKRLACATFGGVLGLVAAQGVTTVLVIAIVMGLKHAATAIDGDDAGLAVGLLALGTIAVVTILGLAGGARCGWHVGGGTPMGVAIRESWVGRAVRWSARQFGY